MLSTIWLLLFCGIISEHLASSQKSTKVKKNNLKVHINATGNTLVMKFLRPNENLKLEGFVLGYGSNFFSNQYIQWPENGKSYLTEVDAEPRYLIAVKPNENSKKSCKEKNSAMKPLQLVVGTLTPTSAFLSWGILINPQIDWSVLNKCPNDRFYTVRYREKNKDWLYQLCPTTEIVIDSLKPSTMYEFGVKDNTENGIWSKSYNHKTVQKSKENGQIQSTNTISKAVLRMAPEDTKALIPVTVIKQGFLNLTHFIQPKSTSEPTTTEKHKATQLPTTPKTTKKPDTEVYKPAPYKPQHSSSRPRTSVGSKIRTGGRLYDRSKLLGVSRNISVETNTTINRTYSVSSPPFPPVRPTMRKRPNATNVTGRPGNVLVPRAPSTARPNRTTVSIKAPMQLASSAPPEGTVEATVFSPTPKSELDALGKIRTTGPHIIYMGKKEFEPCSITESLKHFPTEEATNQEIVSRPLNPPSNLTIVTVEGCPSFVILDWEHPENETVTEYKVISTENGAPPGKDQSIITTNQTFSTVENLKANASYQFLVVPSNPLGEGPASNTVEFSTESADPRVSEPVTAGKDAIWTQIKFKSDSYSECKGKQFVKRTWYKKFVGIQLCNSLRYKIYLSDSLLGTFYNIGDQSGFGEDHCQFVDSFLDGRTGQQLLPEQLKTRKGFYRAVRQQPVEFGEIGGYSQIRYVHWYECGIAIPGKW